MTIEQTDKPHAHRIEDNTRNSLSVTLQGHGTFATSLCWIRQTDHYTKRELARMIAEAYGGGCGDSSHPTYWLRTFPKGVLQIVYHGMVHPFGEGY